MRINGNEYRNTLHGTTASDEIYGYGNDDTLFGGDGWDYLYGGRGNDWLYGGIGRDWLSGQEDNDHLYGEADGDHLHGGGGDDWLYGGDGDDDLHGEDDNDHLYAGDGADDLYGGGGNDWLHGDDGADYIDGGDEGHLLPYDGDTAAYGDSDAMVFVSLATGRGFNGDAEGDRLVDIENLSGSRFGDLLVGDDGNNALSGLGGDDTLWGGQGADDLKGGEGNDTLNGGGNPAVDPWGIYIEGRDVLTGDLGADKFVFSSIEDIGDSTFFGHGADVITDFNRAEGDQINLHAIDADDRPEAPGNQDFSTDLVPEGVAFTRPGQISWQHDHGETWITLNADDDSRAEATIHLYGSHTPEMSWFVF
jgi:Ca2+-binding RTX toxin-like protein